MSQTTALTFGAWIALLSGIWFLFDKSETVASDETKRLVTQWLRKIDLASAGSGWPATFVRIFDHVFGQRHLSWRCFWRSSLASLAAVVIVSMAAAALAPAGATPSFITIREGGWLALFTVISSIIPDYLSLLETRYLLGCMRRAPGLLRLLGLLILDLLATALIAASGLTAAWFTFSAIGGDPGAVWRAGVWQEIPYELLGAALFWGGWSLLPFPPAGVWMYAAFFTSVWVWLYALSGLLVRVANPLGIGIRTLKDLLDIDEKPITSLGFVAMLLTSIVFWVVALTRWLAPGR